MSSLVPLDDAALAALLEPTADVRERYPLTPQSGPIRWREMEMKCVHTEVGKNTNRRYNCHAPTNYTWRGVPQCRVHLMQKANELLIELGITE